MRDTALFTALRSVLNLQFAESDLPATKVKQSYQPVHMGTDTGPTVYFQKLFDEKQGWPYRKLVWDPDNFEYVNGLIQWVGTTFQVSAVLKQTAAGTGWTASDLVNEACAYLQSDAALEAFAFVGLRIMRISQVRNPPVTNGQDQFEFIPNFDFVLTHEQITLSRTPGAVATELVVKRV